MNEQQGVLSLFLGLAVLISGCGGESETALPTVVDEVAELQGNGQPTFGATAPLVSSASPESADACVPTEEQQLMLELVNQARSGVRQCGLDLFQAGPPLQWSCDLEKAAAAHSLDMKTNNFFSHQGSDGLQVANRIEAVGYPWQAVGENIAAGYLSAESAVKGWLKSSGHCKNLMNPVYSEFGSAVEFTQKAEFSSYWTQVFGDPR